MPARGSRRSAKAWAQSIPTSATGTWTSSELKGMILFIKLKTSLSSRQTVRSGHPEGWDPIAIHLVPPRGHLFLKCILTQVDLPAFPPSCFQSPLPTNVRLLWNPSNGILQPTVLSWVTLTLVKWVIPWGVGERTLQVHNLIGDGIFSVSSRL